MLEERTKVVLTTMMGDVNQLGSYGVVMIPVVESITRLVMIDEDAASDRSFV